MTSFIYMRDRSKPYIQDKICTHGVDVVEGWKTYTKPSSLKRKFWSSIKERGKLVVFTAPNVEEVVAANIYTPLLSRVIHMEGSAFDTVVIENIIEAHEKIGEIHIDQDHPGLIGKKMPGSSYSSEDLTHIKLLIDISDIIAYISNQSRLKIDYSNLGKISTLGPTN